MRGSRLYTSATAPGDRKQKIKARVGALATTPPLHFETVFDAMAWDAANPREAVATSLVGLEYGLDQIVGKTSPQPAPATPVARFGTRLGGLLTRSRVPR